MELLEFARSVTSHQDPDLQRWAYQTRLELATQVLRVALLSDAFDESERTGYEGLLHQALEELPESASVLVSDACRDAALALCTNGARELVLAKTTTPR